MGLTPPLEDQRGALEAGGPLPYGSERWRVSATQTLEYEVILNDGIFERDNRALAAETGIEEARPKRRLVILDYAVDQLYGQKIRRYFQASGISAEIVVVTASESRKTFDTVFEVAEAMQQFRISRRSEPVIAVGGGVLLDIVGFAASLYRRGIPYIRVPTTLVSLVDAGIGAKTGVNFALHKNRLGTYYPPLRAFLDRGFLRTQDDRNIANGVAEIVKIALVKDEHLFVLLEQTAHDLIPDRLQGHCDYDVIVHRAIAGMLEELAPNLWEKQLERVVDYGHTFSPTLEMQALPELLHGEAVAIDMAFSLILAQQRALISEDDMLRALCLLKRFGLPISHRICTPSFLVEALQEAKRHRNGLQRMPLTCGIGQATFVNDVIESEIAGAAGRLKELVPQVVRLLGDN